MPFLLLIATLLKNSNTKENYISHFGKLTHFFSTARFINITTLKLAAHGAINSRETAAMLPLSTRQRLPQEGSSESEHNAT